MLFPAMTHRSLYFQRCLIYLIFIRHYKLQKNPLKCIYKTLTLSKKVGWILSTKLAVLSLDFPPLWLQVSSLLWIVCLSLPMNSWPCRFPIGSSFDHFLPYNFCQISSQSFSHSSALHTFLCCGRLVEPFLKGQNLFFQTSLESAELQSISDLTPRPTTVFFFFSNSVIENPLHIFCA